MSKLEAIIESVNKRVYKRLPTIPTDYDTIVEQLEHDLLRRMNYEHRLRICRIKWLIKQFKQQLKKLT